MSLILKQITKLHIRDLLKKREIWNSPVLAFVPSLKEMKLIKINRPLLPNSQVPVSQHVLCSHLSHFSLNSKPIHPSITIS